MDYYVGRFIIIDGMKEDADEDGWIPEQPALIIGVDQTITVVTPEKKIRSFTSKEYDPEFFDSEGNRLDCSDKEDETYVLIYRKAEQWESWHTLSVRVQTNLETAKRQAEKDQAYFRANGWSGAVVKVCRISEI